MYTFYCCALWTFLLLRILNSINYDCPCIRLIFAQYYFQYFANFLHPSFIIQSIILHFANFLQSSLMDQGLLHFANVIHLSIDQGFFAFREYLTFIFSSIRPFLHFANIIHPSFHWSGLFLAFREHHTSIFLLFKAFFLHFANIIHPSFYCLGPFLHISKFIHPFLSLRINLFTFWALIY